MIGSSADHLSASDLIRFSAAEKFLECGVSSDAKPRSHDVSLRARSARIEMMNRPWRLYHRAIKWCGIFIFGCSHCIASSLAGKSDEELLQIMLGGKDEHRLREEAKIK